MSCAITTIASRRNFMREQRQYARGATIFYRTRYGDVRMATVLCRRSNIRHGSPGFLGIGHELPKPDVQEAGPALVWGYDYQVVQVLASPSLRRRLLNLIPSFRAT